MKFINIIIYLSLPAFFLTSPYAMEKKEQEGPSSKVVTGTASSDALAADLYRQDPPIIYQSMDRTLFLSNLIDIDATQPDLPPQQQDHSQAHARIDYVLATLERIPPENDVLCLVFQECFFETETYLRRILESCLSGEKRRLNQLKKISFDAVIFSQACSQVLSTFRQLFALGALNQLKGNRMDFVNCHMLEPEATVNEEEPISQASQDKAKEAQQQILANLAKYAQYRTKVGPTVRFANLRAFAELWDATPRYFPTSPRFMSVPEADQKSPRAKKDEASDSQDRAHEARQQIFARHAEPLAAQSTSTSAPTSVDANLRGFAALRRDTKSKESLVSPRPVTTLYDEQDYSSSKSLGQDDGSTLS